MKGNIKIFQLAALTVLCTIWLHWKNLMFWINESLEYLLEQLMTEALDSRSPEIFSLWQVKGRLSGGHWVFQLSGRADGRLALPVPARRAHYWWESLQTIPLVGSPAFQRLWPSSSFFLNRTFQSEVGCRLPGLLVQVAGPTVLWVQLGGRRAHRQEVPEVHRRLHEQTPVQDHSIQRLQGERRHHIWNIPKWINSPNKHFLLYILLYFYIYIISKTLTSWKAWLTHSLSSEE